MNQLREPKGLASPWLQDMVGTCRNPSPVGLQELSAGEIPFEVVPAVRALEQSYVDPQVFKIQQGSDI